MESRFRLGLLAGLLFIAPLGLHGNPFEQQTPAFEEVLRLGSQSFNQGRYLEAERYLWLAIVQADARSAVLDGVRARVDLAAVLTIGGQNSEAEELLETAQKTLQARPEADRSYLVVVLINLGAVYRQTGQYRNSESVLNQAKILINTDPSDKRREIDLLSNLGVLYAVTGREKLAQSILKEAVALEDTVGHDPIYLARTLTNLATVYYLDRKWKLAEPILVRARQILDSISGVHPEMSTVLSNLGFVYAAQNDFIKAEAVLRKALDIRRDAFGAENLMVAFTERYLADALSAQTKFDEAGNLYSASLRIQERLLGTHSKDVAVTLENFAKMLRLKTEREAAAMERRARSIRREQQLILSANK